MVSGSPFIHAALSAGLEGGRLIEMSVQDLVSLPIDPLLSRIVASVRDHAHVILTATPGAGKTTRLPPELLKAIPGKIAVLQPRRMAAIAACHRIADERGWTVGEEVGYQVRFEAKQSARTRVLFMTDALMLRRLSEDPELREFSLVVIDEFHERNLNQDLILGCIRELQELGSNIKLLIMSATLDVSRLLEFLPGAVHVDVPGKVFPLEIRHSSQSLSLNTNYAFIDRVVQATVMATRETRGDVLVFLPGTGEIARVADRLAEARVDREIVPLHGSLPLAKQTEALRAPQNPRVILSTNVAEASVTVQGVDYVIDTGLAKVMETDLNSGFSSLELMRISQFNARQRAGRAARQKAGVCLRLWTVHEETTQAMELAPECQRSDLSGSLLLLAHLGVSDFANFAWFDSPPPRLLVLAMRFLRALNALDSDNRLTDFGRQLLRYPLPPRWGATMALADREGVGVLGARLAALLNERDFVERTSTTPYECDVIYRLSLLEDLLHRERVNGVHQNSARTVLESVRQLERLLKKPGTPPADMDTAVRKLLLRTQTDRLCRRRGSSERGLMVGGRGVKLSPDTQVKQSEFFLALQGIDLPGQNETTVAMACGMSKAFVLETLKDLVQVTEDIEFVEEKGRFFARRVRRILDLPIEEPTLTPVDPALVADRLGEILAQRWDWLGTQNERLGRWMKRWQFFTRFAPEYSDQLKPEHIEQVVSHAAFGKTSVAAVVAEDLVSYLESAMGPEITRLLHKEAPEKFTAPSGHSHNILYEDSAAYVEVRLQEIFGLIQTPRLILGRTPLAFRLLGPNYRPVQVTSDLEGFWGGAYIEVRKELRSRYPKHSWPDDPMTAKPEAKGRRR